jgi:hypothetical protein
MFSFAIAVCINDGRVELMKDGILKYTSSLIDQQ